MEGRMKIHSIFKSINGEVNRFHQGSICIFIRLAGCSLKCRYCFGIVSGRRIPRIICSKVPNKKITEIEKGDFLLTYDDSGKLVETEVTDVLIREVDKWIRLTIHGKQYFVTEEHPFFTTKGLVTAQELKVGDKILHSTPTQKISFNKTILNPMKNPDIARKSVLHSKHRIGYNFWKGDRVDGKQLQALNGFVVEKIKTFDRNKISPSVRPKPLKVYNFTCYPYNTYLVDYMWVHNCDTVQAQSLDSGKEMDVDEIINEVVKFKNCYRITITGGEPLLQEAELEELVNRLSIEYDISIETNGAHQIKKVWPVSWVVDYKCSSSGMKKKMLLKNYQLAGVHDIIKFVISNKQDFEDAVYLIDRVASIDPVYAFSPMFKDGKPVVAIDELLKWIEEEEALEYSRIVINVQIHKFLNVV
jgi:7-carboxy-7-deazaguanine synthase